LPNYVTQQETLLIKKQALSKWEITSLQFHDYSTISVGILQNVHFIVFVSTGAL